MISVWHSHRTGNLTICHSCLPRYAGRGGNPLSILLFLFLSICFFYPNFLSAEVFLSLFMAPSIPFQQDIKVSEYDLNQNQLREILFESQTYLGYEIGAKLDLFFHKNFGVGSSFFYSRAIADFQNEQSMFKSSQMKQERYNFGISGILRYNFSSLWIKKNSPLERGVPEGRGVWGKDGFRISSLYFGFGLGAVYSDFDFIAKEWGYGGQLFLGAHFPLKERWALFSEVKYFWAPDVGSGNHSPGENLKTSGNPNNNFSNKLFGPHNDTQFLSFLIGAKFRL